MRSPDVNVLVACQEEAIAGFAVMQFGDTRAHLVLMCVQPPLRRQGVGHRLLDWLLATAEVAGMASIHLELRADNAAALAFYSRLGFHETLVVPGYYGGRVDARRMLRLLRSPTVQQ
jgi:ribosomal-protein-alanine N-acetyltransferase